jgi:hypothetical protein
LLSPKLKKLAISMMKRTYAEAEKVLVLDRSLYEVDLTDTVEAEPWYRIISSPWMTRLWTYQESIYARNLHFHFRNRNLNFSAICRPANSSYQRALIKYRLQGSQEEFWDWKKANTWMMDSLLRSTDIFSKEIKPDLGNLELILSSFQARNTSKLEDEPICLGTLLDLDTNHIQETPKEQRMRAALAMTTTFPSSIVFNRSPHLTDDGFRWAPVSFLSSEKNRIFMHSGIPRGIVTPRGLRARYDSVRLPRDAILPMGNTLRFREGSTESILKIGLDDPGHQSWRAYEEDELGILFHHVPDVVGRNGYAAGILVSVKEESEGTIFARFEQVVKTEKMGDVTIPRLLVWAVDIKMDLLPPSRHNWCIG